MCKHYDKNCEILCNKCCKYYSCRICHDENENHKIDRYNIYFIKCLECDTEQISKQHCINPYCNIQFSKYYCNICNLFDNNSNKDIYHCNKCNICRIGKTENFYHCDICNGCYPINLKGNHKCIKNIVNNDCCICFEDLFHSREGVQILKCGHVIHVLCMKELIKYHIQCPLCKDYLIDIKKLKIDLIN